MRIPQLLAGIAAVAAITVAGCLHTTDSTSFTPTDWSKVTFDSSLHVSLDSMNRTVNNDYYRDLVVGTGATIGAGATLTASYVGYLAASGQVFDSGTVQFDVGVGEVIPGWDDGIPGIRIGGTRQLVIPPEMAYGPSGVPGRIPGNAVLVFNVVAQSSP